MGSYYDYEEKVLRIKDGDKSLFPLMFNDFFHIENRLYYEKYFKVIIPNSVEKIRVHCFSDMHASEYQIPDSVKEIHHSVFRNNDCLKSIQWPSSAKIISNFVFYCCKELKKVVLPEGLKKIGIKAFVNCIKLSKIAIPTTVDQIGEEAFLGCESLKCISLPANVKTIERGTFQQCTSLETVKLFDGLSEIKNEAFASCKSLITITIPTTVETFGRGVFRNCEKLKEIYAPKELYNWYGKEYFNDNTSAEVIPYDEPMNISTNTIAKPEIITANTIETTATPKREFRSFNGVIRTNLIANKKKK